MRARTRFPSPDVASGYAEDSAEEPSFDAYPGPYPIDHLDEAIVLGDSAAVRHFFTLLLPLGDTHETIVRILCRRDASTLLTELMSAGYWPPADVLRELLGICATAGSSQAMTELLDLAEDRGIVCDALATGWVSALAGQAGTGTLIQRIDQTVPGSVGVQAIVRALEAAQAKTLNAVLECVVGGREDTVVDAGYLNGLIGSLVHDCVDALTIETASVLSAHGLDPRVKDARGKTLIERVYEVPSVSSELRVAFDQWINALPDGEAMAMHVMIGNDEAFVERCRQASDASFAAFDAQACLNVALSRDHTALARVLLAMGAEVDASSEAELAPLFTATAAGATACVDLLLKAKADPNAVNAENGACCLTLAASTGHDKVACLLLEAGADATRFDVQGNTALHYVAVGGGIDLCARLLRAGAQINARNLSNGNTPLSLACRFGERRDSHEVIGFLVDMGANVESTDFQGRSPLALASMNSQTELMNTLLAHGADREGATGKLTLRNVERIKSMKSMSELVGLKTVALKMISLMDRAKSTEPAQRIDQPSLEEQRDYDQAA